MSQHTESELPPSLSASVSSLSTVEAESPKFSDADTDTMGRYESSSVNVSVTGSAVTPDRIRKRNGEIVDFNSGKIRNAIAAAGDASGEFTADTAWILTLRVLNILQSLCDSEIPGVEKVQDIVEEVLLGSPFKATAKAYILHRSRHAEIRRMVEKSDLDLIDLYLDKLDWRVKENSNMGYSLQGLNNHIASSVSRVYWLGKLYSPAVREAHIAGDFHIHDLGLLSVYCVGWDLQDLLISGFKGAANKAESLPAKHFRSALGQIVNFFYTLQGEAAGAQAFSSLDTLLAPFIRADSMSYGEVKQALQEFVFNLNVATRVGFQTPFTNVTLDLRPPARLADQPVIIGCELMDTTYGDYTAEMDVFNRALLEVLAEGDAKGRVFTFPIPTYNITPDFDWDSPGLDALWQATAKYGIPNFANFINSELSPDDARSMCCRLRLDVGELRRRGGGLFGANPLTGSVGVVTINMPRLGMLADDEADFLSRLDRLMDMARESLCVKRKTLESLTDKGLYPYTSFYLRSVKQRFGRYWDNHFSTIGILGMNEACRNLLNCDIGTQAGQEFSLRVLAHMRDRLAGYQRESGDMYNLEATPAESTCRRLAGLDREKFPDAEISAFYTNSSHLPVNYSDDPFEVLDLQDDLQSAYTGGTALHFFMGESASDPNAVKQFVRSVCENYHLPCFTVSPTFSICPEHGYLRGEQFECPDCGTPSEVYSRVVGYLRPVGQWNDGKQAEFAQRVTFNLEPAK